MPREGLQTTRPLLAFVYHPVSFGAFELAGAAEEICDLLWVVDTTMPDVEFMTKLLRRLGRVIDVAGLAPDAAAELIGASSPGGILALTDGQLRWTAHVAERLGLPFHTPDTALRLTDKIEQRRAVAAAGLAVPGFWPVPEAGDDPGWKALEAQISFPAVLKPREGAGSRHVVAVSSLEELRAQAAEARAALSPRSRLTIEEYIRDRPSDIGAALAGYVSVESIISDGIVSHLAITGRTPTVPPFRESGFFIPALLEPAERDAVLELASAVIAALGVTIGSAHTEIKLTPDGPRVIELNGRAGGRTPEMVEAASGVDMLPITMRLALGETVVYEWMPPARDVVFVLYKHALAPLRVVAIEGLERLRAEPGVESVTLNRGPGQSVDWRDGNWGHVFSVHGRVGDHEQLKSLVRLIESETRILGE